MGWPTTTRVSLKVEESRRESRAEIGEGELSCSVGRGGGKGGTRSGKGREVEGENGHRRGDAHRRNRDHRTWITVGKLETGPKLGGCIPGNELAFRKSIPTQLEILRER
jgi:hypothetical protein